MNSRSAGSAALPVWSVWFVASVAVAALALFYRLGALPVQVWDEGRLANNALEMSEHGFSLVTTYDGMPDHWNTKPPLLIWLMAWSIQVFGPSEWSIRLPSVVAGLLTAIVVFWFCAARVKSPAVGFAAVLMLMSAPGYVQGTDFWSNPGEMLQGHAARSGNYDAVLALFTTLFLIAGYLCISGRSAIHRGWLVICACGVLLAFLTKSVQALIFLPALVGYAAYRGKLRSLLGSRTMWLCGAIVILVCIGYYIAREHVDPGFIQAAFAFDFGRYSAVSDGHRGDWSYYLWQYRLFPTIVPFLVIGAAQALVDTGERRELSVYIASVSAFYLVVISLSATKLWWYAIPLVPLSAIAFALAVDYVADRMAARHSAGNPGDASRLVLLLCATASLLIVFRSMQLAEMGEATAESRSEDLYSYFLRGPITEADHIQKFVVLHPGYSRDVYYIAPTLFYANVLRARGRVIAIQPPEVPIPVGFDTVVVCSGEIGRASLAGLRLLPIIVESGCGVYRLI